MNPMVIIIIFIVFFAIGWIVYTQKARYYVRRFFEKAANAELLYQFFKKAKFDDDSVEAKFEISMSYEDVKDVYTEVSNTIKYYEQASLGDFEEETLEKTYEDLQLMAKELRHWLWVNNNEQES